MDATVTDMILRRVQEAYGKFKGNPRFGLQFAQACQIAVDAGRTQREIAAAARCTQPTVSYALQALKIVLDNNVINDDLEDAFIAARHKVRKPRKSVGPRPPRATQEQVQVCIDGIRKGLSQTDIGKKLGLADNSMVLTQAYTAAWYLAENGTTAAAKPKTWEGKSKTQRQREVRAGLKTRPGIYKVLNDMGKLTGYIETLKVEDFNLADLDAWDVSFIHSDLVSLSLASDRLLSAVQGWLEDGDVLRKIDLLEKRTKDAGCTESEVKVAKAMVDKLRRKLARLSA
jgi:hypothetical protein